MTATLKRLFRLAFAGAALPCALLIAAPAGAVVLNINDINCERWVLGDPTGDPPNQTQVMTCTSIAAPTCTISGPT